MLLRPKSILKLLGSFAGFLKIIQPILTYTLTFQLLELTAGWSCLHKAKTPGNKEVQVKLPPECERNACWQRRNQRASQMRW